MENITFAPDQHIELQASHDTTIETALREAILIASENTEATFDLTFNGFLFSIEHDSEISSLIDEYNEWLSMRTGALMEDVFINC